MSPTEIPPGLTIDELIRLMKGEPVQMRIVFVTTNEGGK